MSTDINHVVVIGRLTRDADLKHTQNGAAIATLSIASNYSVKRGESWEQEVNFLDLTLFGKRAESLAHHLIKGKQIAVSGQIRQERWEKDGQKHNKIKIIVDNIELLGSKGESGQASQESYTGGPEVTDDEIPF